ncbi:MAG TPA: ABC transporter permease, partial [Pyrinomonadaceae bacterium]|nr:ABC transporter permease [Pyrinomonadaceae bacterium]
MLADLTQDIRYGFRSLVKNPVFSLVAIFTIAMGIGANVVVFTLVERILLSPLPFGEPDRIVRMVHAFPEMGLNTWGLSQAQFTAHRNAQHSFDAFAVYQNSGAILTGADKAEYVQVSRVTADFFRVFGVNATLGRTFAPDEDTKGKENVVVLSHALWASRFGSDPGIVGKQVTLSDVPMQVIGVMPPTFQFPTPETQLWAPNVINPQATAPFLLVAVGKLKQGVSAAAATSDTTNILLNAVNENPKLIVRQAPPAPGSGLKTIVTPLKEVMVGSIRNRLLIAQVAVAFVLLIACANVANLLLSRATKRTSEIALRLALGASPGRVIRQLLTESVVLALIGAAAGVAFAWLCLRALTQIYSDGIPRIQEASIGGVVLLVTVVATVATGLLFGVIPAFRAYWLGVKGGMTEGQKGSAGQASKRLNSTLVVVQLALSLVLLVGAGLVLKSFRNLMNIEPGFEENKVLTMIVPVSNKKGSPEQLLGFYQQLLDQVRALPGVNGAAIASNIPFSGRQAVDAHVVEGMEPTGEPPQAEMKVVGPDYFKTMGITLLQGRDFNQSDYFNNPETDMGRLVAIVDQTLARQYFPNGDAIGKRIRTGDPEWFTIIGVVSSVKEQSLMAEPLPHIYFTPSQVGFVYGQSRDQKRMYLVVNTENPTSLAPSIREKVQALDPNVPVYSIATMSENIWKRLGAFRLINFLLTAFSVIALLLAAIGTYGVMSVSVNNRTPEFAIRQALGAQPRNLLVSVLRQGCILAAIGIAFGLLGSWGITRAISSQLVGVSTTDPLVFTITPLILILVALLASFLPARRAAQTDP